MWMNLAPKVPPYPSPQHDMSGLVRRRLISILQLRPLLAPRGEMAYGQESHIFFLEGGAFGPDNPYDLADPNRQGWMNFGTSGSEDKAHQVSLRLNRREVGVRLHGTDDGACCAKSNPEKLRTSRSHPF